MKTLTRREDVTDMIVSKIVADLAEGVCPWVQPFTGASLPCNAVTMKPYRGANIVVLWSELVRRGFRDGRWLTYKQAIQAGGFVKRGERSTPVIFYSPTVVPDRDAGGFPKLTPDGKGMKTKVVPMMKLYYAFNIEQCSGVDHLVPKVKPTFDPHIEAGRVIAKTGANIQQVDCGRAFYERVADRIVIPPMEKFRSQSDYLGVIFHELAHWTGHVTRLNRLQEGIRGDDKYAEEELVAEMAAAFVCGHLGLEYETTHASYIASWHRVLKNDSRVLFKAASKAQKACDRILGVKYGEGKEVDS